MVLKMKPKDSFFLDLSDQGDAPTPAAKTPAAKPAAAAKSAPAAKAATATKAAQKKAEPAPERPSKPIVQAPTESKAQEQAAKQNKGGLFGAFKAKPTKLVDEESSSNPIAASAIEPAVEKPVEEIPVKAEDALTTAPTESGESELLAADIANTATINALQQLERDIELLSGSNLGLKTRTRGVAEKLKQQLGEIVPGLVPVTFAANNLKAGNTVPRRPRRPGASLKGFKDMASDLYRS